MERRVLGQSGLEVSRIALGAMTFGWRMPPISNVDARAAEAMLDRALAAGVNLVDTADAYSAGESEEILAPWLARHRDRVLVATKLGMGGGAERPLSHQNIVECVEASLHRLRTDRIDVLYLHRPDRATPIEETFGALDELVRRGLVRAAGVSNWTAGETGYAVGVQRGIGQVGPSSVQIYWSLVGRESEHEIVPTCDRLGIGIVVWSPLAGGYLSGRSDGRRSVWAFPPVDESVGALAALGQVAGELDVSVAQVALAWLLHRSEVTSVIIGASSPAQLEQNLAAAEVRLDGSQLDRLSQASAIVPTYPTWWDAAMGVPSRREG